MSERIAETVFTYAEPTWDEYRSCWQETTYGFSTGVGTDSKTADVSEIHELPSIDADLLEWLGDLASTMDPAYDHPPVKELVYDPPAARKRTKGEKKEEEKEEDESMTVVSDEQWENRVLMRL